MIQIGFYFNAVVTNIQERFEPQQDLPNDERQGRWFILGWKTEDCVHFTVYDALEKTIFHSHPDHQSVQKVDMTAYVSHYHQHHIRWIWRVKQQPDEPRHQLMSRRWSEEENCLKFALDFLHIDHNSDLINLNAMKAITPNLIFGYVIVEVTVAVVLAINGKQNCFQRCNNL